MNFRAPGPPEMIVVGADAFGQGVHSDRSFLKRPAKLTALYALATPSRGGDTAFASFCRSYADLDERTRAA